MFQLSTTDREKLDSFKTAVVNSKDNMFGYPIHCHSQVADYLKDFKEFVLNNLGDPFVGSYYKLNTFEFEREVVEWFAKLYNLNNYWGYVTNGGSEGNLKAVIDAKNKLDNPVAYCTDKAHYSVPKSFNILGLDKVIVKTEDKHQIDVRDLSEKVDHNRPALLVLTVGTTMAGAIDDIGESIKVLREKSIPYYVHVDAALSGLILPFLLFKTKDISFNLGYDSLSISGHKLLGCPSPCGIYLSKTKVGDRVEYINSDDTTVFGSRDGHSVLSMWCAVKGYKFTEMAYLCLDYAEYIESQLQSIDWPCWRFSEQSNTVMIKRPPEYIVSKWQLASEGDWSHVIAMPHFKQVFIDDFIKDLRGPYGEIGNPSTCKVEDSSSSLDLASAGV